MQKRQLLQDGTKTSAIGLGCMSFAGFYGASSEAEAHETLAAAQDVGMDFLDTSNTYGMGISETYIGSYLAKNSDNFTIASKVGIWKNPVTGERGFNNEPAYMRAELEASLKKLNRDHLDLYYIHRVDPTIPVEDTMQAMLEFKKEGKIRGIGFSEISPATLRRAAAVGPVDALQSEYSLWTRYPELGILQTCAELNVAFVPFSPLARGMLSDVTLDPSTFGNNDIRKTGPRFLEPNFSFNMASIERYKAFAHDNGYTPAALAIAWCLSRGDNLLPIPGTRNAAHLRDWAVAADTTLSQDMLTELETLLPVGWAHGDRYSHEQWVGAQGYC